MSEVDISEGSLLKIGPIYSEAVSATVFGRVLAERDALRATLTEVEQRAANSAAEAKYYLESTILALKKAHNDESAARDATIAELREALAKATADAELYASRLAPAQAYRDRYQEALKQAGDWIEQQQDLYGVTWGRDILKVIDAALSNSGASQ